MPKFLVTKPGLEQPLRVEAKSILACVMKHKDATAINPYVPKMVTRRNLMTGQEYQEPEDTPGYLSPASEAYWSM